MIGGQKFFRWLTSSEGAKYATTLGVKRRLYRPGPGGWLSGVFGGNYLEKILASPIFESIQRVNLAASAFLDFPRSLGPVTRLVRTGIALGVGFYIGSTESALPLAEDALGGL